MKIRNFPLDVTFAICFFCLAALPLSAQAPAKSTSSATTQGFALQDTPGQYLDVLLDSRIVASVCLCVHPTFYPGNIGSIHFP